MVNNEENEEENRNRQPCCEWVFQLTPNDNYHQGMNMLERFEIYVNEYDELHQEQFVAI